VDLFNPNAGDLVLPGSYMISGVALDPLAQQGSGIDHVSFYLGRRDQGGLSLGSVTPSGGLRQQSFSVAVDLPNADPGTQQQLVAYAHSQLSDKTTELSLPIVMGRDASHPVLSNPFLNTINTNPGTVPANCAGSSAEPVVAPPVTSGSAPEAASRPASTDLSGTVVGSVSTCTNGAPQPAIQLDVRANGTNLSALTDEDGAFELTQVPAPGTYTISVSDGGQTAMRQSVPVAPGEVIDVGTLELGGSTSLGCGEQEQAP